MYGGGSGGLSGAGTTGARAVIGSAELCSAGGQRRSCVLLGVRRVGACGVDGVSSEDWGGGSTAVSGAFLPLGRVQQGASRCAWAITGERGCNVMHELTRSVLFRAMRRRLGWKWTRVIRQCGISACTAVVARQPSGES